MAPPATPLEIAPLHPAQLHHFWNFLEAGLHEIKVTCKNEWEPEDHYAGIYSGRLECFLMRRDGRLLGFYDAYTVPIVFGKEGLKYFIYTVWSVPPRHREPEDLKLISQDRKSVIEFMKHRARALKCQFIETVSPRHFDTWLGFEEHERTYRLSVGHD